MAEQGSVCAHVAVSRQGQEDRRRTPYSPWLAQPFFKVDLTPPAACAPGAGAAAFHCYLHFSTTPIGVSQVNAAVGCLARIPLPQGALRPLRMKRGAAQPASQRPAQKSAPAPPARPAGQPLCLSILSICVQSRS
jgi:hypothetical protein